MTELGNWIESAADSEQHDFRCVVHIILNAISNSHDLQSEMVMKGGVLLAIRYKTGRYTRDIDFSTSLHYTEFKKSKDTFITDLSNEIAQSAESLPYNLACRVQSNKIEPSEEGNFQTLTLSVGYAHKGDSNSMKRLRNGQSSKVVKIDYSFNEILGEIDILDFENSHIQVYSTTTLVAEKLRAILQQGSRDRSRKQDIYDLYFLLTQSSFDSQDEDVKELIHALLLQKAASRGLRIQKDSMSAPEIAERSQREYSTLSNTIDTDLPEFNLAFRAVQEYYESFPWDI